MKHNSPERFESYREQFYKGLLDADMRPRAVCMDPAYVPDALRFARRPEREEQVGLRRDLDDKACEALKHEVYASYNAL